MKEIDTEFFIRDLLKDENITFYSQWQWTIEIVNALKWSSKTGWKWNWNPEFVCIVKDFLLVIEIKKDLDFHIKFDEKNLISQNIKYRDVKNFSVN